MLLKVLKLGKLAEYFSPFYRFRCHYPLITYLTCNKEILNFTLFRDCKTWHVPALCFLMMLLGVGNIIATSWTIPSKIKAKQMGLLKMRFTRLDKYFWSHSNRTQNLPKVSLFLESFL